MGLRILHDQRDDMAALYCSTSDWAFGPVFYGPDADDKALAFVRWLPVDARTYEQGDLEALYATWVSIALDE